MIVTEKASRKTANILRLQLRDIFHALLMFLLVKFEVAKTARAPTPTSKKVGVNVQQSPSFYTYKRNNPAILYCIGKTAALTKRQRNETSHFDRLQVYSWQSLKHSDVTTYVVRAT